MLNIFAMANVVGIFICYFVRWWCRHRCLFLSFFDFLLQLIVTFSLHSAPNSGQLLHRNVKYMVTLFDCFFFLEFYLNRGQKISVYLLCCEHVHRINWLTSNNVFTKFIWCGDDVRFKLVFSASTTQKGVLSHIASIKNCENVLIDWIQSIIFMISSLLFTLPNQQKIDAPIESKYQKSFIYEVCWRCACTYRAAWSPLTTHHTNIFGFYLHKTKRNGQAQRSLNSFAGLLFFFFFFENILSSFKMFTVTAKNLKRIKMFASLTGWTNPIIFNHFWKHILPSQNTNRS